MYAGVPSDMPVPVSDVRPVAVDDDESAFAMPKSVTTATPPLSSTLSGLMSRCTTSCACAYASARATSRRMPSTSASGSAPAPRRRSRSDCPSTKGMV
jgi:hypothetical protein